MDIDTQDYVWTDTDDDDWIVRVIVPGMKGEVEVINKMHLTETEMGALNIEEFKPDQLIINFYVRDANPNYCAVTNFPSRMVLEIKYDEGNDKHLGYADLDERKWKPFTAKDHDYRKENEIATVYLETWPADPPVAWGF